MKPTILIANARTEITGEIEHSLRENGYAPLRAADFETILQQLRLQPDLMLLDLQLARDFTPAQRAELHKNLELAETACLRLQSTEMTYREICDLAPSACATISAPHLMEQVLEQVKTQLRIRQVEEERNLAQGRLALHRMEVEEGLRSAAYIQHTLLPRRTPNSDAFSFAWEFIPCETVGGDLFNVQALADDTLMAYMLDVSGHGVSSAMVTVSVNQSLSDRTSQLVKQLHDQPPFFRISSPAEVLAALDEVYPYERFEKFFTITYLLLEKETGRVRYSNGGHPPPILVRTDGQVEKLTAGGTLVGLGGLLPYEEGEIVLQPGDRLYLYSDGITEYTAASGQMFGDERLVDYFSQQQKQSLEGSAAGFMQVLKEFGGNLAPDDDISLFCIQFNAPEISRRAQEGT